MSIQRPASAPVQPEPNAKKPFRKKLGASKKANSRSNGQQPWEPWEENRAVAAAIWALADESCSHDLLAEIHRLGSAILNCAKPEMTIVRGVVREVPMRSGRHILCSRCAWLRARRLARAAAARVVLAHERDPGLHYLWLSLTVPEMEDLDAQLKLLFAAIDGLRRSMRDHEPLLEGLNWHIEIERGRSGNWRTHLHAIGAVRREGWETKKAVLHRWIDLTRPGLGEAERSKALERQHCEPLWSQRQPDLTGSKLLLELGRDAFASTRYAAKPLRLSVSDRLYAFGVVNGRHLSDSFGVFRGQGPAVRADALTRIGGAALLERTHTDILARRSYHHVYTRKLLQRHRWLTCVRSDGRLPADHPGQEAPPRNGRPSLKQRLREKTERRIAKARGASKRRARTQTRAARRG